MTMSGITMNHSIPYDPFSTSYLIKDQQAFDFSPVALYSPLQDFNEFGAESAASPELESPLSPDSSFTFPQTSGNRNTSNPADWSPSFDDLSSPDVFIKQDPFDESPILDSIPAQQQSLSASPAINPMDLSAQRMTDDVPFGGSGGLVSHENAGPLFPSPQLARIQNPGNGHMNHCAPPQQQRNGVKPEISVSTRPIQRPVNGMKRKSSSDSSCSSPHNSASPSPPPGHLQHHSGAGRGPSGGKDAPPHAHVALPPKKTAHNMIEKRYRNNLNDKISALRDAVPALRVMVHRLETHHSGENGSDEDLDAAGINGRRMTAQDFEEDLGGLAPAHKLNKATILSKATEYISHLERRNRALARENQGLRSKVEGFEMLMMNGAARSVWC